MQYSYFSVISEFSHKKSASFSNVSAVLPPPTLYKVETRKKMLDTRVQQLFVGWGEGLGPCE